jgi:hypothetical protein
MPFPKDTVLRFYGYGKLATFKKLNGEPALFYTTPKLKKNS